jgi:hypothetical protein
LAVPEQRYQAHAEALDLLLPTIEPIGVFCDFAFSIENNDAFEGYSAVESHTDIKTANVSRG